MQKIPRLFKTLAILMAFSAVNANAEVWVGNGGNIQAMRFVKAGMDIIHQIRPQNQSIFQDNSQEIRFFNELQKAVINTRIIISTDPALGDKLSFYAGNEIILLNADKWNSLLDAGNGSEIYSSVLSAYRPFLSKPTSDLIKPISTEKYDPFDSWKNTLDSFPPVSSETIRTCIDQFFAEGNRVKTALMSDFFRTVCEAKYALANASEPIQIKLLVNEIGKVNMDYYQSDFGKIFLAPPGDVYTSGFVNVNFVDTYPENLVIAPGYDGQVFDAVNVSWAPPFFLFILKERWNNLSNMEKMILVIHEYLGLDRCEQDRYANTIKLISKALTDAR